MITGPIFEPGCRVPGGETDVKGQQQPGDRGAHVEHCEGAADAVLGACDDGGLRDGGFGGGK